MSRVTNTEAEKLVADHERIWLQNAADGEASGEGRMWCQDKVWPVDENDGEPTEYVRADLYADALATIERVERERDEALLELGKARLCVNCGQTVKVEDISEVGDCSACQGPDGLSACTFDMVPAKAFEIWRDRYYGQRERVTALDAEMAGAVADEREACAALLEKMARDRSEAMTGQWHTPDMNIAWRNGATAIRARQALSRSSTEVKNDG